MPEHVSILQLVGVVALALAAVIWVAVLVRVLRRDREVHRGRFVAMARRRGGGLRALPHPRRKGPHVEHVELTPAEQDTFALLARRLSDDRL
ncbi:uncharacterized protein SGFS_052030 [Streptomyces graminofaciens]|uniref:Secreted protein n=1 Tax=Streptomyces graminofaciens TaxID=68212 RepID=A0ABN5VKV9_9ACTN|nr:hypothetical protein [Streptomyces graminofaciens]BBC33909.1 uncharacterized protein SGFS_052030 [Streptomyces graminofaciens]